MSLGEPSSMWMWLDLVEHIAEFLVSDPISLSTFRAVCCTTRRAVSAVLDRSPPPTIVRNRLSVVQRTSSCRQRRTYPSVFFSIEQARRRRQLERIRAVCLNAESAEVPSVRGNRLVTERNIRDLSRADTVALGPIAISRALESIYAACREDPASVPAVGLLASVMELVHTEIEHGASLALRRADFCFESLRGCVRAGQTSENGVSATRSDNEMTLVEHSVLDPSYLSCMAAVANLILLDDGHLDLIMAFLVARSPIFANTENEVGSNDSDLDFALEAAFQPYVALLDRFASFDSLRRQSPRAMLEPRPDEATLYCVWLCEPGKRPPVVGDVVRLPRYMLLTLDWEIARWRIRRLLESIRPQVQAQVVLFSMKWDQYHPIPACELSFLSSFFDQQAILIGDFVGLVCNVEASESHLSVALSHGSRLLENKGRARQESHPCLDHTSSLCKAELIKETQMLKLLEFDAADWYAKKVDQLKFAWQGIVKEESKVAMAVYLGSASTLVDTALRQNEETWASTVKCIEQGIQDAPESRPNDDIVVYRGQTELFGQAFVVGDIITVPCFFIANLDLAVAKPCDVVFEIILPATTRRGNVACLDELAAYDSRVVEDEYLVRRKSVFAVLKNDGDRITLCLMGSDVAPVRAKVGATEGQRPICVVNDAIEHPHSDRLTADENVTSLLANNHAALVSVGFDAWRTSKSVPWLQEALQHGWPKTTEWIARRSENAWHSLDLVRALISCSSQEGFDDCLDTLLRTSMKDLPQDVLVTLFTACSPGSSTSLFARAAKYHQEIMVDMVPGFHRHVRLERDGFPSVASTCEQNRTRPGRGHDILERGGIRVDTTKRGVLLFDDEEHVPDDPIRAAIAVFYSLKNSKQPPSPSSSAQATAMQTIENYENDRERWTAPVFLPSIADTRCAEHADRSPSPTE